jgi:flagellar motor switch protein FliG
LPTGIAPDSVQALVWERPVEGVKLMRAMLNETPAEGQPASTERLARLCVALGQETAGELFKRMPGYEIEKITQAIAHLKTVPQEEVDALLEEFCQLMQTGEWINQGGVDFARQALERALGPNMAQDVLNRVVHNSSQGFYILNNVAPDQIAPFISYEHPQTVALILSQLEPAKAAGVLALLTERLQADVSYRISTMENVLPNVIRQIEESLEASLRDILGGDAVVGGPKVMADILNLTGSAVEKNVLDQIDAQDPEVSEGVRNLMFVFEDVRRMSDRDIQVLLQGIDEKDLAISLKAATEGLKDKVLGNMSEEARQRLTEEMEYIGPMRLTEVEEVQLKIVQSVRQLEEQRQVTIVRGEADDQFV